MFIRRVLCAASLLACLASPAYAHHPSPNLGSGGAGPITTIPAATMPQGQWSLGLSSEYIRSQSISDSELATLAGNHVHAHSTDWTLSTTLGVSYGVTENLDLSLSLPYIHRENIRAGSHSHGGGGATNTAENFGDSGGLGDLAALAKYRIFQEENKSAALLFGAKLPTGQTGKKHAGEKLEAEHQPGSGSWDAMAGLAASGKAGSVSLDANALYTLVNEGTQNTDLGDRVNYNVAASKRIRKAWDTVLELNGEWMDKKKTSGQTDENSGGTRIYLSTGIRYAPSDEWSAHAAVSVPVAENIGRGHAETDYKITFGFSRPF